MSMIQPIDGNALLNALRAGREDRWKDDKRRTEAVAAEAARAEEAQWKGLVGQVYGQKPGIAGQYASPSPGNIPMPGSVSGFGGGTFNPDGTQATMAERVGGLSLADNQPVAPQGAPPRQAQPDPDILRKLVILRPEQAGKLIETLGKLDENELKRHAARNMALGTAAHYLANIPANERQAALPAAQQYAIDNGATAEEVARMDLSDRGLKIHEMGAIDYDKMIDNELAQREFMAGKTVPVAPGGNVATITPMIDASGNVTGNKAEWLIGGGGGGAATSNAIPPAAIEDLKRSPGTAKQFDEIFGPGAAARILGQGGQTGASSGAFLGDFRGIPGEQVTSGYRSAARNAAVGGVGNSFHKRKDAQGRPLGRDSVPPRGMSMATYHAQLARLNPDKDVINEGDHVHMEPKG